MILITGALGFVGSATRATRMKMAMLAAENLQVALEGGVPPSLINHDALRHRRT